jgi:hypothetical protein
MLILKFQGIVQGKLIAQIIRSINTEEYYKLAIFIPLLDNVINDLKKRFHK